MDRKLSGVAFAMGIDGKSDMGLFAVSGRPSGLPIPALPELSVLQSETFGVAVHAGNAGCIVAAQNGAEFPPG